MSRLETDVKPLLTAFLDGTPLEITGSQQALLTKWVIMKLMVSEWINRKVMFDGGQRFAFRNTGELPHPIGVTLLMHNVEDWKCNYYALSLSARSQGKPVAQNVKIFSFGVGRAFFNVLFTRIPGAPVGNNIRPPHFNLYPPQGGSLNWPLESESSAQQLSEIANYMGTIARQNGGAWVEVTGMATLPAAPEATPWEPGTNA